MTIQKINPSYRKDVESAVTILKNAHCKSIYLFGSVATNNPHEKSDIDIGVCGLEPERFFSVYAQLSSELEHSVDLVDFDEQKDFFALLTKLNEAVQID